MLEQNVNGIDAMAGNAKTASYDRSAWDKPAKAAPARAEAPMISALRAEHRHMASVMELMSAQLDAVERGDLVDTHVLYEIMHYMVSWPDQFHHPREDLIYGRVAELDAEAADNVDSLQREHDGMARRGRQLLQDIEGWREGSVSGAQVVKGGRDYVQRTYRHMNTEEKLVFPQIQEVLTTDDWRELAADDELKPIGDPVFGTRVQREFRNLARKLRRGVRRSVERGTMAEWVGIEALMESMEVLSIAVGSGRGLAGDHVRAAWEESVEIIRETPFTAPMRCAVNNTRISFNLLGDLLEVSRDALDDLARVNQERKDRIRLLDRGR